MRALALQALDLAMHLVQGGVNRGKDIIRAFFRAQDKAFAPHRNLRHLSVRLAAGRFNISQVYTGFFDAAEETV